MFTLPPRSDLAALQDGFARNGFVQIPDLLSPGDAAALHAELRGRKDWVQVLTTDRGFAELDRATRASMSAAQREALDTAVYARARTGFQYRYETIRVPDDRAARLASDDLLCALAIFLSSNPVLDLLRQVTGSTDMLFADAQATAYAPGDFLTGHDDAFKGKNRRAAYVLNLTPTWRIEWGGLLLFHGADGHVTRGLVPSFNTLNIFGVPLMHSVSEVTRASPYRRYSVTGWLRAETQS